MSFFRRQSPSALPVRAAARPSTARPFGARAALVLALAACGVTAGCNRSSSGGSASVVLATALGYQGETSEYRVGVEARALVPEPDGAVVSYSIAPPLPAGLTLDPKTGVLGGIPTAAAPLTAYTITAQLANGGAIASTVRFLVADTFAAARYGYSLTLFPGTITAWRYDAGSKTYLANGGDVSVGTPVRAEAHPLGDRLFVLDSLAGSVVTFAIDPESGVLERIDEDSTGMFPIALEVSADGRFVYTGSEEDLRSFRVDPITGRLQPTGPPLAIRSTSAIAVDPSSSMIAVGSAGFEAIGVFTLDADDGSIGQLRGFTKVPTPYALEFSPDGRRLYTASLIRDTIDVFDTDPPAPVLARLDQRTVPAGTFDLEVESESLWAAHFSASALSEFELDADAVPAATGTTVLLAGTPTSVRPNPSGGYAAPLFDAGFTQYADAVAGDPLFIPQRRFLADFVLAPAAGARERSTPFTAALDAGVGAVVLLSSNDGTPIGSPNLAGPAPRALATDLSGRTLAIGDGINGSIRRFDVDALQPTLALRGSPTPAGFEVRDLALDGGGRRLWALTEGQLITYEVPLAGATVQIDQAPIGPDPARIAADASGRFIACTDRVTDQLFLFGVSPASNEPIPAGNSPVSLLDLGETSVGAGAVAFEPLGRVVIVALEDVGAVRTLLVNTLTGSTQPAGTVSGMGRPVDLAVRLDGLRVFVADAATPALHLLALDPKGIPFLLDTLPLDESPTRLVLEASGQAVQFLSEDGGWGRASAPTDVLQLDATADLGLTDALDLAPISVWVDAPTATTGTGETGAK
ncbi:beta-propeller fold lactonase family protein [Rohdeia mirabilis]